MVESNQPLTYKDAGVDIDGVTKALRGVAEMARGTHTAQVLTGLAPCSGPTSAVSKIRCWWPARTASAPS